MEQSLYELPEGWVWSNIGKAGVVTTGNTPPKKNVEFYTAEGGRPFVKPPQLGLTHPITDTPEQLSELGFRKSKPVEKGSILVCCIGSIGKVGVAGTRLATNQQINSITFGDCVDWRWGYYFALTLESIMNSMANSAVVSIINKSTFSKIPIPIPPLREQKRIVAKLDALFTRIDAAITHLQETLELSKALFASALDGVFMKLSITHPQNSLGEIGKIIRGSSPRPKGDPQYYGGNVPRLMVADVTRDGKMVTPRIDSLTEDGAKKSRPVPKETLTIQVSGNPGTPAILAIDACIHDGFAALIDVDQNEFSSEYLYYALLNYREQSNRLAVGAIFRNLTTSQLRKISVPIAGVAEQRTVVNKLDAFAERTNALEAETQKRLDQLATLKSSLLDSAFRGQL